ncbi:MAG: metallopeptidase family protein [Chloroflexota bacterium]
MNVPRRRRHRFSREEFEDLVARALEGLPERFLDRLDNVVIQVEDEPSRDQLEQQDMGPGMTLLGLYEGVPLTDRGNYQPVLPDRITLFQLPIERTCRTREEIVEQVRDTVVHEVAHYFGIDDDRLDELGL